MLNPWEKVHIDLYGPMPTGESILGIIDASSRWPEIHIIKSTTSATITNKLNITFSTHGFPYEIVTDNAPNLTSVEITDFCKHYGIHHHKATPYWPKGNSEIERFYRTLGKAIKSINAEGNGWRKEIFYFMFQYRRTPHCTTKETPAKLRMGRELRGKIPAFTDSESKFLHDAKQNDLNKKEKMKIYYDKRFNTTESSINVGDYVLLRQRPKNKLLTKFNTSPYKVISKRGSCVVIEKNGITKMRNSSSLKKIPNFVSNSNERGGKYNKYYDCDDDLDFNTPHSLVDHEEMNTPEETSIHERPKRLRNPNPRYNDYVLY